MKITSRALLTLFLTVIAASLSAQLSDPQFYFIWNEKVIKGWYADTLLCNGEFNQYAEVPCKKNPFEAKPTWEPDLETQLIVSGRYSECQPAGTWLRFQLHYSGFCGDCKGNLGWEQTDYSNLDTVEISSPFITKFFDRTGKLLSGNWGFDKRRTFSCGDVRCTIYNFDLKPITLTTPQLLEMKIDSLLISQRHGF